MDRQSAPPGPEIGWAFGGIGFVATVFVGWLMDAGVGFGLVAVVFWVGIGSLFAFLVERSTIEENDRVDELQNTRLATLAPAVVTSRPATERLPATRSGASTDGDDLPQDRPAPDRDTAGRGSGHDRPVPDARPADAPPSRASDPRDRRPRPDRPRTPSAGPPHRGDHPSAPPPQPRSPREYREARAESERQGHAAA